MQPHVRKCPTDPEIIKAVIALRRTPMTVEGITAKLSISTNDAVMILREHIPEEHIAIGTVIRAAAQERRYRNNVAATGVPKVRPHAPADPAFRVAYCAPWTGGGRHTQCVANFTK